MFFRRVYFTESFILIFLFSNLHKVFCTWQVSFEDQYSILSVLHNWLAPWVSYVNCIVCQNQVGACKKFCTKYRTHAPHPVLQINLVFDESQLPAYKKIVQVSLLDRPYGTKVFRINSIAKKINFLVYLFYNFLCKKRPPPLFNFFSIVLIFYVKVNEINLFLEQYGY